MPSLQVRFCTENDGFYTKNGGFCTKNGALITACGQLSEPAIPPILGKDDFAGPSAHTAHWPVVADQLAGKKVAIVGTGASCMQLLRNVAKTASHVTVFQQIPAWFTPNANYHREVEDSLQQAMKQVPLYQAYYRFRLYWGGSDGIHAALFPGDENDTMRHGLERSISAQVAISIQNHEFCGKNPKFCITNDEFCIKMTGWRRPGAAGEGDA